MPAVTPRRVCVLTYESAGCLAVRIIRANCLFFLILIVSSASFVSPRYPIPNISRLQPLPAIPIRTLPGHLLPPRYPLPLAPSTFPRLYCDNVHRNHGDNVHRLCALSTGIWSLYHQNPTKISTEDCISISPHPH